MGTNNTSRCTPRGRASCAFILVSAVAGVALSNCKKDGSLDLVGADDNSSKTQAIATAEILETGDLFTRVFNKPFSTRLDSSLPQRGTVPENKIPYSGWYYPWVNKGTAASFADGSASALTLYDRAFNGGQSRALDWERAHHSVQQGASGSDWYGHCNGWSAASIRHAEPRNRVTRNGQVFQPHHIKALLTEINMNAKFNRYLAGVPCRQASPRLSAASRQDPAVMSTCEDVNPGTFHLALANWLGKAGHPVVFDMSPGEQLWNYPVYDFSSSTREIDKSMAEYYITGRRSNDYRFNPSAKRFFLATTTVIYAKGTEGEPTGNVAPSRVRGSWRFQYVLETTDDAKVIGGEWSSQNQTDHPDFVWVPFEPTAYDGTLFNGNPNLNVTEVIKLWAESIGADPNNPPTDITEPPSLGNWGFFGNFSVFLDGASTGTAFLGKPIDLLIRRESTLAGEITLAITLNNESPVRINARGQSDLRATLQPLPGINEVRFTWTRGSTKLAEESARFHAVR